MKYPKYPAYKYSGVEWIGEIPDEWQLQSGRSTFKQTRVKAYNTDLQLSATQKYGVVPQTQFMEFEDHKVMLALKGTDNFKHVDVGDFVISLRSFQGGIEPCHHSGCVSPAYTVLKNRKKINSDFFKYLFKSQLFIQIMQSASEGIRDGKTITYKEFGRIILPIPDLKEQENISDFLNKKISIVDTLILKQQQLIELLKEKRQAIITHAVTKGRDPNVPMKDSGVEWVGEIPEKWNTVQSKWLMSCNDEVIPENSSSGLELTYVEISDVDFTKGITNSELMKFEDAPSRARRKVRDGDIIISNVRTYLKAIAEIKNPDNNLVVSTGFAVLRPRKVLQSFAKYALSASYFIEKVISESFGVSYPAITADRLVSIKLAVPDIKTQEEIADFLDKQTIKIDSLVKKQEEMIDLLKEYRSTLISAAVTGKIDVRNLKINDFPESE